MRANLVQRWFVAIILAVMVRPVVALAGPPIELAVDASEAPRKVLHAKLVVPAQPGPLTLCFPQWIPGTHGPTGPITSLAGLKWFAGGQEIPWKRDEIDMYAFHCTVPDGARAVEIALNALTGTGERGEGATANMAVIRWNQLLLYPKGPWMQDIQFQASLRVPADWKLGTALPVASQSGLVTRFAPVSLETLIDSPALCGVHFRELALGSHDGLPHFLELACDSAEGLEMPADVRKQHERLVKEAGKLFGARHYRSYRFLVTLSDELPFHGLEHHESSDNGGPERMMVDKSVRDPLAFLLPHEYVHSWCGKQRRPAGLITPTFQDPQRTDLLWVYEGLTEYLGTILTARCGLWTSEETRAYIALTAEAMQTQRGRTWRPLIDTTVAAPLLAHAAVGWASKQRVADYYDEGVLIWLEVDARIRQLSHGKRSLDDFCKSFFGGDSGMPVVKPYTFAELVACLNAIAPHDWEGLFNRRLQATGALAPLEGIVESGWRLGHGTAPSALHKETQAMAKIVDQRSSIGVLLAPDGSVKDVIPGSAADQAGLAPKMKLLAVNTRRFSPDVLSRAIEATGKAKEPLQVLAENGEFFRTFTVDYHDGLRYPRLERNSAKPDLLSEILKPAAESSQK
jgi:predicted metalloprotease with PDZ domain